MSIRKHCVITFTVLVILIGLSVFLTLSTDKYIYKGHSDVTKEQFLEMSTDLTENFYHIEDEDKEFYTVIYNFRGSKHYPYLIGEDNTSEQISMAVLMSLFTFVFTLIVCRILWRMRKSEKY